MVRSLKLLKASCVIEGKANMCSYRLEAKVRGRGRTGDWPLRAARHRIAARPRPRATPFAGCLTARFRGCAAWHGAMAPCVDDTMPKSGSGRWTRGRVRERSPYRCGVRRRRISEHARTEMKTPARPFLLLRFDSLTIVTLSLTRCYVTRDSRRISRLFTLPATTAPYTDLPCRDLRRCRPRLWTRHALYHNQLPESPHRHVREP